MAFTAGAIAAEDGSTEVKKKVMVAVKTDDVELHELDISHLHDAKKVVIIRKEVITN